MLHKWTLHCHMAISYLEELLDLYAPYKTNVIKSTKNNLVPCMTKLLINISKNVGTCISNQLML